MRKEGTVKNVETVKSLEKALAILNLFSRDRKTLGVTEISNILGYSKTSTHRIVSVLKEQNFLIQNEDTRYAIGPGAFRVGCLYTTAGSFADRMNSALRRLRDNTGVTVQLCVLESNDLLVINSYEGGQFVKVVATTGMTIPLVGSASGDAVFAAMGAVERARRIEALGLDETRRRELDGRLKAVKRNGFARSASIFNNYLTVFAKAITAKHESERYVISALAVESMLTPEFQQKIIAELNDAVYALELE